MKKRLLFLIIFLFIFGCNSYLTGRVVQQTTTTEYRVVLVNSIVNYLTSPNNAILNVNEIKDLLFGYFSTHNNIIDLSRTGYYSQEKLADIYNKAKGTQSIYYPPKCELRGGECKPDACENYDTCININTEGRCKSGNCCSGSCTTENKPCTIFEGNIYKNFTQKPSHCNDYNDCVYKTVSGGGWLYGKYYTSYCCLGSCTPKQSCNSIGGSCKPYSCENYDSCNIISGSSGSCSYGHCCSGNCLMKPEKWKSIMTASSTYKCDQLIKIKDRQTGEFVPAGQGYGYGDYFYTSGDAYPAGVTIYPGQEIYFLIEPEKILSPEAKEYVKSKGAYARLQITIIDKNQQHAADLVEADPIVVDEFGNELMKYPGSFVSAGNGVFQGNIIFYYKPENSYIVRMKSHLNEPSTFRFSWSL